MSDFIPGTCTKTEELSSQTTSGTTMIVGKGLAAYSLIDDKGNNYILKTKMSYAPSSKYRLMAPQWLGMQDKEAGVPKDKRSKCVIDDEYIQLIFDDRQRTLTVKHDSNMLVPVTHVNPGIKKFQSFAVAFQSIIQNENENNCEESYLNHPIKESHGIALSSMSDNNNSRTLVEATKLIEKMLILKINLNNYNKMLNRLEHQKLYLRIK